MGEYDRRVKGLVNEAPQDFVSWLVGDAQFVESCSTEFVGNDCDADALLLITIGGKEYLLHIEFQKGQDTDMALRMWQYNAQAQWKYGKPVYSVVIYLTKIPNIHRSPHVVRLHHGEIVHRFRYQVVRLWDFTTEELFRLNLKGLLPLVPFLKDGLERKNVVRAIDAIEPLKDSKDRALLSALFGFGALVYTDNVDKEWLLRNFNMHKDILRESWIFQDFIQEVLEKGFDQGLEKGLEQGLEKGQAAERSKMLDKAIQRRFPALITLVEQQRTALIETENFEDLLLDILMVDEQQARQMLLDAATKTKQEPAQ